MYNSTGDSNYHCHATGITAGFRPLLVATPFILIGMFLTSVALINSSIPSYLPYICAVPLLLWTYYIWQMHTALSVQTQGAYPVKPMASVLLAIAGTPFAAALSIGLFRAIDWSLERLTGLAADIQPVVLPILESAQSLMQAYAIPLQILLCIGIVFSTNYRLTLVIRSQVAEGWSRMPVTNCSRLSAGAQAQAQEFHCNRTLQERLKFGLNPLGSILGFAMALPGCIWLLKDSVYAKGMGLEQDWQSGALLSSMIAFTVGFLILAKLQGLISSSMPQSAPTAGDVAALPLADSQSVQGDFGEHAA